MSDRVIISLAAVPMISGALLLLAFQRTPALPAKAATRDTRNAARSEDLARDTSGSPWLGVVVAGNTAELAADQAGRVTDVWLSAGARVQADQPILQIDSSDAVDALGMAGAELGQRASEAARAAARLEEAESRLARLRQGGKWIADHEIEQTEAEVRMASADLRAAQAAVRMGKAKVSLQRTKASRYRLRAPFAGTLVARDVDPGDSVGPGQVLARVISDDRHVRFAMPPEQAPSSEALYVVVREPASGRTLRMRVDTIKPEVDTSARLVFATARLAADQESAWLPGTRVEVVPESALIPPNERLAAPQPPREP